MTVIFVSGLIGAGKSEFCSYLQQCGADVVSADVLVAEMYEDADWCRSLENALGREFRKTNKQFDKAKLAQTVFNSPELLETLEQFIHPQVKALLQQRITQSTASVFVYEIPILRTDTDLSLADVVVLVEAPRALRLERLIARGMSSTDATQRMLIQEQDSDRVSTADVIVENAGTQNDLRTQAQLLFEKWSTQ